MHDIKAKIVSNDINVLEQSLHFVRERATQEAERGKTAETRATAMLALLSILAGFIVPLQQSVAIADGDTKWALLAAFLTSLLFLVKGLYYAISVLSVARKYRLKVETVYDFQPLSRADALRDEIAGLVWESTKAVQPNTEKLFRLHRCQRSGLIAIILFMLFGILLFAVNEKWISLPLWVGVFLAVCGIVLLGASDLIAERWGIWGRGHRIPSAKNEQNSG